jgi:hypothetical protein
MQASFPDVPTESLLALFRPQPHADADTNARELARALVGADPTVRHDVCAMLTWHTGYVSLSLCVSVGVRMDVHGWRGYGLCRRRGCWTQRWPCMHRCYNSCALRQRLLP